MVPSSSWREEAGIEMTIDKLRHLFGDLRSIKMDTKRVGAIFVMITDKHGISVMATDTNVCQPLKEM